MYKQLKKMIADKKLIHEQIIGLENRIQYKIDNQLGLKGMSFSEVKIELIGHNDDKFARVFASIENLEKDKDDLIEEEKIIQDILDKIDAKISELNDIEHKVFKGMYLWGMTTQEIADKEGFSRDRIKQISQQINKKMKDYTTITPTK